MIVPDRGRGVENIVLSNPVSIWPNYQICPKTAPDTIWDCSSRTWFSRIWSNLIKMTGGLFTYFSIFQNFWCRFSKFWKRIENSKIKNLIFGKIIDRLVEWLLMSFKLEGEFISFFSILDNLFHANRQSKIIWSLLQSRGFLFLHVFTNSRIFVTW